MAATSFEDFDPEQVDQGGLPKPGKVQLLVSDVEEHDAYINVTHEILAHEKEGQVGKVSYNSFNVSGKGARRAFLFALATGILTKADIAEAKTVGTSIDIPYESAVGRVYFGTLEASEYNGKPKCRVEWDFRSMEAKAEELEGYPFNPKFAPKHVKPADTKKTTTKKEKSATKTTVDTPPVNSIPW